MMDLLWPNGITFPEVTDDYIGKYTGWGYCYESDLMLDMRSKVLTNTLVLDIGAHIGVHTMWLAGVCGCKVVSFEPVPELAAKLRANVAANGLEDRVTVIESALSDRLRRGRMDNTGNTGQSHFVDDPEGPVHTYTLDSFGFVDVSLIKMDVEHHEMQVLAGAERTIDQSSPLLYIEGKDETLDAWMYPRGYKRFGTYAFTPVHGYRRNHE